jgi:hypothetical protein
LRQAALRIPLYSALLALGEAPFAYGLLLALGSTSFLGSQWCQKQFPLFAKIVANLNGWTNGEDSFIFYRDDEVFGTKRDGTVQKSELRGP